MGAGLPVGGGSLGMELGGWGGSVRQECPVWGRDFLSSVGLGVGLPVLQVLRGGISCFGPLDFLCGNPKGWDFLFWEK